MSFDPSQGWEGWANLKDTACKCQILAPPHSGNTTSCPSDLLPPSFRDRWELPCQRRPICHFQLSSLMWLVTVLLGAGIGSVYVDPAKHNASVSTCSTSALFPSPQCQRKVLQTCVSSRMFPGVGTQSAVVSWMQGRNSCILAWHSKVAPSQRRAEISFSWCCFNAENQNSDVIKS